MVALMMVMVVIVIMAAAGTLPVMTVVIMTAFSVMVVIMTAGFFMMVIAAASLPMAVMILMGLSHLQLRVVHGLQNFLPVQLVPGRGNHSRLRIMLPQKLYARLQLLIRHTQVWASFPMWLRP